jgi:hypothetical protein
VRKIAERQINMWNLLAEAEKLLQVREAGVLLALVGTIR